MKISTFFSAIFALLGTAVAVLAVLLCLGSLNREPRLLQVPGAAVDRVDALFQAVCNDDYPAAAALLYGQPELGAQHPEEEEGVSTYIWDAFVDSMGYELVGDCYAAGGGIAQQVQVSYLDITSVTGSLRERSRALLQQRMEQAEDVSEIYDENNEFRQDFVDAVVAEAAREALRQDARYVETELTVNLVFQGGQWWILADDALMQVLSGGIAQ